MRYLTAHIVNPANDRLTVAVDDEPGHGNACHRYSVQVREQDGSLRSVCFLDFQNGPIGVDGNGVNGITHEVLLAVLADRLTGFQSGPYACEENERALHHILAAQASLQSRTRARMARGVEGTHTV